MRRLIPFAPRTGILATEYRSRKPFRLRFGLRAMILATAISAVFLAAGAHWHRLNTQKWHRYYNRMENYWLKQADRAKRIGSSADAARANKLAAYNAEQRLKYER